MQKILLIDDDPAIRIFMQDFFEERDYSVETAATGLEGLEKYQKGSYELVISDMMMPELYGLDVLKKIREKNPEQRVIMLTAVQEPEVMEKARQLGCRFYLVKPFSLSELEARVKECLQS